jgi:S-adenosyl-L-methionine hydrolase (adenosine-forming)
MHVVTVTSDWNQSDHYLGSLKGKILSDVPGVHIIDLNHSISPYRLAQAAFVIRNSYFHFPKGTIHLVCVNSEPRAGKGHLVIEYDGHFFVTADNGLVGLVCNDEGKLGSVMEYTHGEEAGAFEVLRVYPNIVKAIFDKKQGSLLAVSNGFERHVPMRPVFEEGVISGSIIYIDSYFNAITNINRRLFHEVGKGRPYEILVHSNHYRITRLNKTYNETAAGELLALFNSLELLEVAIKDGNAAELLNLNINSVVRVKFGR